MAAVIVFVLVIFVVIFILVVAVAVMVCVIVRVMVFAVIATDRLENKRVNGIGCSAAVKHAHSSYLPGVVNACRLLELPPRIRRDQAV